MIGAYRSLEMARAVGMAYAVPYHPGAEFTWRQYNDGSQPGHVATWGLMAGGLNTYVTIHEVSS